MKGIEAAMQAIGTWVSIEGGRSYSYNPTDYSAPMGGADPHDTEEWAVRNLVESVLDARDGRALLRLLLFHVHLYGKSLYSFEFLTPKGKVVGIELEGEYLSFLRALSLEAKKHYEKKRIYPA